jgi:hypothetical protein
MSSGDDDSQRALALHAALSHEDVLPVAKAAGFSTTCRNDDMVDYHVAKLREMVKLSSGKKRKTNQDQMLVRDAVVAAVVSSPNSYSNGFAPSMSQSLSFLGLQDLKKLQKFSEAGYQYEGQDKSGESGK